MCIRVGLHIILCLRAILFFTSLTHTLLWTKRLRKHGIYHCMEQYLTSLYDKIIIYQQWQWNGAEDVITIILDINLISIMLRYVRQNYDDKVNGTIF